MQYVSSDTNIWFDFETIKCIELPFKLPYTYLMERTTIKREILTPPDLRERLLQLGLQPVKLTIEEANLLSEFQTKYLQLSASDFAALAIAKARGIILLTGDLRLRKAAASEGVKVSGTIGILDQLLDSKHIDLCTYKQCITSFLEHSHDGGNRRLPEKELRKRLLRCE